MRSAPIGNGTYIISDSEEEALQAEAIWEATEIAEGRIFVSPELRDRATRWLNGTLRREDRVGRSGLGDGRSEHSRS